MLNNKGFDNWSGHYDEEILKLQDKGYPFEGYYRTLGYIQKSVLNKGSKKILDIGIGTGLLSESLYRNGLNITGIDFSNKMIEQAKQKMPNARFIQYDFNSGLPEKLNKDKFDHIISSYAIHHISDNGKIEFFNSLGTYLNPNGTILIGDISFQTQNEMLTVKEHSKGWDESEYYFIYEEISKALESNKFITTYKKTSNCSGVLKIQPVSYR